MYIITFLHKFTYSKFKNLCFSFPGEALGAIGDPNLHELLEKYQNDPAIEVAETCQIALQRLNWLSAGDNAELSKSKYMSIDPAPPSTEEDVETLKNVMLDESKSLFERYRAMFSLRNLGTTESINAIGEGSNCLLHSTVT